MGTLYKHDEALGSSAPGKSRGEHNHERECNSLFLPCNTAPLLLTMPALWLQVVLQLWMGSGAGPVLWRASPCENYEEKR